MYFHISVVLPEKQLKDWTDTEFVLLEMRHINRSKQLVITWNNDVFPFLWKIKLEYLQRKDNSSGGNLISIQFFDKSTLASKHPSSSHVPSLIIMY